MGHHLDDDRVAAEDVAPAVEVVPGEVGTADGERPAELGGRAEQDASAPSCAAAPACSATRSRLLTGLPRSPRRWVAETSRHSAAQPRPSRASSTTRGRVRRTGVGVAVEERTASGRAPPTGPAPGLGGVPVRVVSSGGAIARSTPNTGRIPACWQACANFTAP